MTPRELEKTLRELRNTARKMAKRKGVKYVEEICFWGVAEKELTATLRELRQQRQDSSD